MASQYNLGTISGVIKIDYKPDGVKSAEKDLDNLEKKGGKTGKALGVIGKGAATGTLALAAGLTLAANSAANFEQRISGIQAVSGASAKDIDLIRNKALQLGKDTKFSASEAASAIEELVKAGVSLPDVLNGAADATVALAAAGEIDLPKAATIASNAMNQFGLAAEDLPRVADAIAGAANASAIDVGEFGFSMSQVGAVAHLAGLSFHDTAVAIAELGNAGIKGSDAGTSLKTFLQNLIPTTKQQIELSKKLGLLTKDGSNAFFDQTGKVKSLAQISQVLQNALKGQSKEQKLANLQMLFGSDAIRAAAVLADNGAAGFDKLAASIDKTKAADVAKTRMNNLKGSTEQLKGTVETLAIEIGENFQGVLKGAVDGLNGFLGGILEATKHIPELIAAGRRLIGDILDKLKDAWNSPSVQRFVTALIRLFNVLRGPIISLLKGLFGAAKVLAPIIGGALVVAFDLLSRAMDAVADVAEFVQRNWNVMKKILLGVGAALSPMVIILTAQLLALGIAATVSAAKQVAAWVTTAAKAVVSAGVMAIQSARVVAQWLLMAATSLVQGAKIIAQWALMSAKAIASVIIQAAQFAILVAKWILLGAVATAQAIKIAAAWLISLGPIALVVAAVIALVALIILNFSKIKNAISAAWNWVKTVTSAAWTAIRNAVSTAISAVVSFFAQLPGRILRAIGSFASTLTAKGRELITGFLNGIKAVIGSVLGFLAGIGGLVIRAVSAAGTWLFGIGKQLIQGFINGIKSMAGKVADAVRSTVNIGVGITKKVLGIASPSKVFHDIGLNTMQGYVNGILAMRNDVGAALAAVGTPVNGLSATVARSMAGVGTDGGPHGAGLATAVSGGSTGRIINVTNVNPRPIPADEQIVATIRQLEAVYG